MNEFFRSGRFKILLAVFVLLFSFLLRSIYLGGTMPFFSRLGDILLVPVTRLTSAVSASVEKNFWPYLNARQLAAENEQLKEEIQQLTQQLVEFDSYKNENDQFRDFLEIKERNPDFIFEPASVVGRTAGDSFGSFIIDVGTYHGVSARDPVITADGLVGVISEVGYTYSKVQTVLDVSVNIGVLDSRTADTGVLSGSASLALDGCCKFSFLGRDSGAMAGDMVVTSGSGGMFPKGLIVGSIESVQTETSGLSQYGVVRPTADIFNAKTVQVIKAFAGKGENPQF